MLELLAAHTFWFWESWDFGWQGGGRVRERKRFLIRAGQWGNDRGRGEAQRQQVWLRLGEVAWLPAQPEQAVTPWGIIK